ncbi:MAG: hypothetical protein IKX76_02870 [Eubacterium sp.]|nr:hypothetical protein [Eubacterium sp.]
MNLYTETINLDALRRKHRTGFLAGRLILACLVLLFLMSVNPLKAGARHYDDYQDDSPPAGYQNSDYADTDEQEDLSDPEESLDPDNQEEATEPDNPEIPEESQGSEDPADPAAPSVPVNPSLPVQPETPSGKASLVTYTANTISKGGYSTTIWKQHSIWGKRSSASRHGCGICVASMALQLSGVPTNPNRVLKQTNRSIRRCKSLKPRQAVRVLKKNHVDVKPVNTKLYSRKQCVGIMKDALDKGKMVMALVRGRPFSNNTHWVLIAGYDQKGRIVVANSSYGNQKRCMKTKKQYHLVNWKQIQKKIVRDSINYSAFLIVG